MFIKRLLLGLAIVAVAVMIVGVMGSLRPEPPRNEIEVLAPLVEVLRLESQSERFRVRTQGAVRPTVETRLSAEVSGIITAVSPNFVAGGVFSAQETLLQIDRSDYRAAVDQASALLAQRKIEYDGASKLRSQGYRAEAEYASAAAALAAAEADLSRAERNLDRTRIRLPYDGLVRNKEVDLGQFVSPASPLGVVFSTASAEVRLPLTESDVTFLSLPRTGASAGEQAGSPPVDVWVMRNGEKLTFKASLVRTEGVLDDASRVTYAVVRIDDPYGLKNGAPQLPIGTFVQAELSGPVQEGLVRVPRAALRGEDRLMIVDADSKLRIRQVRPLRIDAQFAYLRDAELVGEQVVLTNLTTPLNGMEVRIAGQETPQEAAANDTATEAL